MNADKFVQKVLGKVDPDDQPALSGLTKQERETVAYAVQEAVSDEFDKMPQDSDFEDFKIRSVVKQAIEDRIQNNIFKTDPKKVKAGKDYVTHLLREYQWTVKNARLLRRLDDSIEEFKKASLAHSSN